MSKFTPLNQEIPVLQSPPNSPFNPASKSEEIKRINDLFLLAMKQLQDLKHLYLGPGTWEESQSGGKEKYRTRLQESERKFYVKSVMRLHRYTEDILNWTIFVDRDLGAPNEWEYLMARPDREESGESGEDESDAQEEEAEEAEEQDGGLSLVGDD
ncbi:hypothetical protein N0V83_005855 [Neocucurbitaria cava]|uniref:Uncharacterized protein n=1 Tax=Neocucurbitaria cava TaxID=798079 RepID=A0A9W9CL45_9PLEO|nr:hypothetical protein N0V83_005855 [Neocucurbitaria cava]